MAHDRDELERDLPVENDEDIQGVGDDEFGEGEDEDDLEGEDEVDDEQLTGEVGSEGGSFGETERTRTREEPSRGSEASETIRRK